MRTAVVSHLAISLVLTVYPSTGSTEAFLIENCKSSVTYGVQTFSNQDHSDLGSGFVMDQLRIEDPTLDYVDGLINVHDCSSGLTLSVGIARKNAAEIQDYVRAAAASSERLDLAAIGKHFSSPGSWTNLGPGYQEPCACAAFYPDATGFKFSWESQFGQP